MELMTMNVLLLLLLLLLLLMLMLVAGLYNSRTWREVVATRTETEPLFVTLSSSVLQPMSLHCQLLHQH